ncbi:putative acetyl-ornithine/Acetyl-lysine deacetylase [Senna tora]|uniref:Putative acetyl-ornithine/Acetyl-lysine deacetylase n=1 Tax=Senna tora TaxID=362788 RepID=A0A834SM49_9FABA|nr:putative acetyl-ornithine/Acetyl-lysine deacetylase [Senna tora]
MTTFFLTSTTTSPSPPCLLQRRRFSPTPHLQASLMQRIGVFSLNCRSRRSLMCAINQDGLTDTLRTADPDEAKDEGNKVELEALLQKSSCANEAWSQFSKRVSGEWDGFGADFSNEGKAIELPESVVPEAYREWEVKVFDWQSQCPTLAEPEDNILVYKNILLLPTVGCEADAATRYRVDERQVGGANNGASAFAYQSSGSYVALWQKEDELLELEYCLISPQDPESRVRTIQLLRVSDNMKMALQSIKVFREQWYGPFRNGDQLGGCSIRDSAFASTAPMAASQVAGIWHGSKAVATFTSPNSGIFQEVLEGNIQKQNCVRDACNEILLPKQLWCSFKQSKDGETHSEVGWLLDHGQAITSSCLFSSTAKLKEISLALETKGLEEDV